MNSKLYRVPSITMPVDKGGSNRAIAIHLVGRLISYLSKLDIKEPRKIGMITAHRYCERHFPDTKLNHEK